MIVYVNLYLPYTLHSHLCQCKAATAVTISCYFYVYSFNIISLIYFKFAKNFQYTCVAGKQAKKTTKKQQFV